MDEIAPSPGELATPTRTFIFGLADDAGRLAAGPLYDAAEAAGFTDTKLRLALRRMSEAGLVIVEGRGRKAAIHLTPAGLAARSPDLVWIGAAHRSDAGLDRWDGRWHLAAFEIPEHRRAARDALRDQIVELFGAHLAGGVYVTAFPWEAWLAAVTDVHGIRDRLTMTSTERLDVGGRSDPLEIAAALWPVADLDAEYRAFVVRWGTLPAAVPDDPAVAVRAAFEMSTEFDQVVRRDPILPDELLPREFAGPTARALYREAMQALSSHEILARANLVGSYESAIEAALTENADDFWSLAFAATSTR
ncbi:MAG: PaaX family transcriptional regulator C-terminal domain-containing protein [Ilumatobacteraceae bacterium]